MKKMICGIFYGCFSLLSSSILLVSILQLMLFLSNQQLKPTQVFTTKAKGSEPEQPYVFEYLPLIIDICLVLFFVLQHSLMACKWYKSMINNCGLHPIERSVYIIFSSLSLLLMMYFWQPIYSISAWLIDTDESWYLWAFFSLIHCVAWLIIFLEILLVDPMELIGWKQVFCYLKGYQLPLSYKSGGLQKLHQHMRHPGAGCFLLILWCHPLMSVDRLFLAWFLTMYLKCGFNVKKSDYIYYEKHMHVKVFEEVKHLQ